MSSITADELHAQLRAAVVAFVAVTMLILGFPGLDGMTEKWMTDPGERAKAQRTLSGRLQVVAADTNRWVRLPVERALAPLQRPLRLAQSWSLYGSGPDRVVRGEVWVDGELWFRSGDPEHAWQSSFLRFRKIRPVLDTTCNGNSPNARHLVAFLAARARRERPETREVMFRCTATRWPGNGEEKEKARWTTSAPDWEPRQ